MMATLNVFLLGAIAMTSLVASAFFFRFWRDTHDRLFFLFGLAFLVDALDRLGIALSDRPNEGHPLLNVVRFVSFALIIVAIIDKNRGKRA